jgi:osmotically-inducible protein OsmY
MNGHASAPLPSALRRALTGLGIEDLHIEAVGGQVYLHGVAACYNAKRRAAEQAAHAAPGACIHNEIRVAQHGYSYDAPLASAVKLALAALGPDVTGRVTIEVRNGMASLSGRAHDARERQALLGAASAVPRVTGVESHLILNGSGAADTELERALNDYVQRAMNLPPGIVTVTFGSGIATLSGSVPSETQRQAIEELVQWHDHVHDVVNNLRLIPSLAPHTVPQRLHPGRRR